jgi:hypothetical protein
LSLTDLVDVLQITPIAVRVFAGMVDSKTGNIRALLPEYESLMVPSASRQSPSGAGVPPHPEVVLAWRGRPLVVSRG